MSSLHRALSRLHDLHGLENVALSSIPLPGSMIRSLCLPSPPSSYLNLLPRPPPAWYTGVAADDEDREALVCFASTKTGGVLSTWAFALPTVHGYFSGVGDLFSAMTMAHYKRSPEVSDLPPLPHAVSRALLTVQQVLLQTHLHALAQVSKQSTTKPSSAPAEKTAHQSRASASVIPSDNELDGPPELNGVPGRKAKRMQLRELRLIAERALIADGGEGWPGALVNWSTII